MAKKKLKDKLDEINNLQLGGQARIDYFSKALADKNNFVVAAAARKIAKENIKELSDLLVVNFARFLHNSLKTDPSCAAKIAIIQALIDLESRETESYLKAIHCVQLEPVWGGHEDTAVKLRTLAAYGLVKSNYPNLMNELAALLADNEIAARVGAISALKNTNAMLSVPLLRYKALIGDQSMRVVSACFDALLALAPNESRDFVASFLHNKDLIIAQTAALALAEAGIEETAELLIDAYEKSLQRDMQKTLCTAMALLRDDKAVDYLFNIIENEAFDAQDAINSLKILQDDNILARLEQISQNQ